MNIKTLNTILFFIKDYKRYVFLIFGLSLLYALFEGLNVVVLFPVISSVMGEGVKAGEASGVIQALNAMIRLVPVKDMFIAACIMIIAIVVLKNILRYLSMVLSAFASYRIWEDMQKKLFLKYINADYRYFLDHKQGEIVYRLYSAPSSTGGILKLIPQYLTEILKTVFIAALLFSMSFPVTCGIIAMAAVFYFFTRNISKRVSYFYGKGRMEACEEQNIFISEMISGIKQIKVFLSEKRWIKGFYKSMDKYFMMSKKDTLWINMPMSVLEIFALSGLSVFLILMRSFAPGSLISNLPLLAVFAYAFQRIMPSLSLIVNLKMQIMGGLPVLEVLHSVMNEKMAYLKDGSVAKQSFNGGIEFKDVSFAYPGRAEALSNVSIFFEKNKCAAIVGPSGSGKTTIVNLLIRLLEPTRGSILVDGIDLRDCTRDSWLGKIGFVSQDTFIFHASVRDNIAFGKEDVSMDDIINAARIANAHEFISGLSQGYDTIVGERGMKLSGGEQQRLAIARAILRNPEILIFDEATSALDNVSQSLIQAAINNIMKDHTVILIAHRLSTIVKADKIVVLDKGVVKEIGNHEELLAKKDSYWRLYNNEKECISVT